MSPADLPEGFRLVKEIDLEKDKKAFWTVNILSLVLLGGVGAIGIFTLPRVMIPRKTLIIQIVVFLLATVLYYVLHEFCHGLLMRAIGRMRPFYGAHGSFLSAGSRALFTRGAYRVIALAPVVFFTVIFTAGLVLVPAGWKWVFFWLETVNLSGAAGDFYIFFASFGWPREVLVQDSGVSMKLFASEEFE